MNRRRSPSLSSTRISGTSASNNADAVVDLMRDAVTVLKERRQSGNDPNSTFSAFIASELRTLSEEDATFVRSALNRKFMECMDELQKQKQQIVYVAIGEDGQPINKNM